MSEVQSSRPSGPRGRGSGRGGRGNHGGRGGRGGHRNAKSDNQENVPPTYENEGEIGELKKKYYNKISTVKELFPDWTDEDIVFALETTDGDLESTIERITEGSMSQWGEVKKKTDRSRSKAKDSSTIPTDSTTIPGRGGRGRGGFDTRGRGRGERTRGSRGGRGSSQANGSRTAEKYTGSNENWDTPSSAAPGTWDSTAAAEDMGGSGELTAEAGPGGWGQPTNGDGGADGGWSSNDTSKDESAAVAKDIPVPKTEPKSSIIPAGTKKTWASMFAKPPPAPPVQPVAPPSVSEKPAEPVVEEPVVEPSLPPPVESEPIVIADRQTPEAPGSDPPITLTPPKDELTKRNVEKLPDESEGPPTTATAASTVASSQDPHSNLNSATPNARPAMTSGYVATALKATGVSQRSSSFQRRFMEQQEAVVMPGASHAVDRAAVQFGKFGLNGSDDLDVDDEREEAETRAQPPQHSPNAPRASLPPVPQHSQAAAQPSPGPAPRPAPGLPPAPQQAPPQQEQPPPVPPQQQQPQQSNQYHQFSGFGDRPTKPYDPFSQQTNLPQPPIQQHDAYQTQVQGPHQHPASTAPSDYQSSYYTAEQQRSMQNYYGNYQQPLHDTGASQMRSGSAFGTNGPDMQSQHSTSQPPTRYPLDAQSSGHNTPNPTMPTHQSQHSQHMPPGGQAYPYAPYYNYNYASYMNQSQHQYGRNRPMYDDVRRQFEDHYGRYPSYEQNQYNYGKGGMYGPQGGFGYGDHASSPANTGGYGQQGMPARDGGFGRVGSAQPGEGPQSGNTGFGNMPDMFGRSSSSFGQQTLSQHGSQQAGNDDGSKSYDQVKAGGPSPSLGQGSNRPASATNMSGQPQGQSGLPPPQPQQNQQQGFGGYGHMAHQYGGLSGLGGHQQGTAGQNHHQGSGYGAYGAGFGNTYYGNSGRGQGQWGSNYGH